MSEVPQASPTSAEESHEIPNYFYSPLDSANAQIRLLTVHFDVKFHLRRTTTPPLQGTLQTYYLPIPTLPRTQRLIRSAKLPPFFALSYVWGDATLTRSIIIDGKKLAITENLYQALRDMQASSFGVIRIWADAICICQDDIAERSAQVLLMREIYHSAADVKIWLGASNEDWIRCLRFINNITVSEVANDVDVFATEPTEDNVVEEAFLKSVVVPTGVMMRAVIGLGQAVAEVVDIIDPAGLDENAKMVVEKDGEKSLLQETIQKFMKWRPEPRYLKRIENENLVEVADLINRVFIRDCAWFERMWVVQELGVADKATIITTGGRTVEWDDFLRSICYLHYTLKAPVTDIWKVIGIEKIRTGWNDKRRLRLCDLIRECRYRMATDPRDKIFSLLGLMGDKMDPYLKPDYSISVAEVYANATLHFIAQSESLDALCGWQTAYRHEEMPSWVPDYRHDQELAPSPLIANDGRDSIFHASGHEHKPKQEMLKELQSRDSWKQLQTTGICIDTVAIISDSNTEETSFAHIESSWNATVLSAYAILPDLTPEIQARMSEISSIISKLSEYWTTANYSTNNSDPPAFTSHSRSSSDSDSTQTDSSQEKDPNPPNPSPNLSRASTLADEKPPKAGISSTSSNTLIHNCPILEQYINTLFSRRKSTTERLCTEDISQFLNLKFPLSEVAEIFAKTVCKALDSGMRMRNLAVTKGGWIGAVPRETRPGDLICVLFGCSVPVVLRGRGNWGEEGYLFVGECYLNGVMDGEAVDMLRDGVVEERRFVLV